MTNTLKCVNLARYDRFS